LGGGKGEIQQERKRGRSERGEGVKGGCEKGDRRGEEIRRFCINSCRPCSHLLDPHLLKRPFQRHSVGKLGVF
jgi:hypothetical protein